jgi:hypothetical protein
MGEQVQKVNKSIGDNFEKKLCQLLHFQLPTVCHKSCEKLTKGYDDNMREQLQK